VYARILGSFPGYIDARVRLALLARMELDRTEVVSTEAV
jgi:hypothetical protein